MSIGGLIGNALAGGAAAGADAAWDIAKENRADKRKTEETSAAYKRQTALEKIRATNQRENTQLTIDANAEQSNLDRQSRERIAKLPGKTGKPYLRPEVEAQIDILKERIGGSYKVLESDTIDPETRRRTEMDIKLMVGEVDMLLNPSGKGYTPPAKPAAKSDNAPGAELAPGGEKKPLITTPDTQQPATPQEPQGKSLSGLINFGKGMRENLNPDAVVRAADPYFDGESVESQKQAATKVVTALSRGEKANPEDVKAAGDQLSAYWKKKAAAQQK